MVLTDYSDFLRVKKEYEGMQTVRSTCNIKLYTNFVMLIVFITLDLQIVQTTKNWTGKLVQDAVVQS